jgi:hypothetical protein
MGSPKIANVDFLETLRRSLCNRIIIFYMFVEVFWCFDLSWKTTLKMPLNLTRARSGVLDIQK